MTLLADAGGFQLVGRATEIKKEMKTPQRSPAEFLDMSFPDVRVGRGLRHLECQSNVDITFDFKLTHLGHA